MIKLKQFESQQATFDYVAKAILEQGAKSTKDGYCAYLSPVGRRCVVGQLVEPEQAELLEKLGRGQNILRLMGYDDNTTSERTHPQLLDLGEHDQAFILDLQRAHDNADDNMFLLDFSSRMLDVAKGYDLDPSAIPAPPAATE